MSVSIIDKRRVAIAYDGSEDAHKLFDWAIKNIVNPTTDHLVLLSAVQRNDKTASSLFGKSPTSPKQGDLPMLSTTLTRVDEAIEEVDASPQGKTARQRLEDMAAPLRSLNISSEQHILWGDAKTLLPRYTEVHKVDLLIVGSRGLGAVKSVFLGSVSDACLKSCPCPVLVVRNTTL
ncbi:adenine nucleotide alpha hydrolases-like protein [Backusella circina FSU 941]|nr:adenine nucleotide alpha hydrolases-like protein [Backusella circina FSU 941]